VAGGVSAIFPSICFSILGWAKLISFFFFDRYGEDKELTEDYAKDVWEFGY
jgi:hypothetical protein